VNVTQWRANGNIWVSITDNGSGIPPGKLAVALEEFQQIDRENREQQGIGMGLPLAKRIIEIHSGKLEIQSIVGKGTQVVIGLPIVEG
jgi:signal transduction histidine kinase